MVIPHSVMCCVRLLLLDWVADLFSQKLKNIEVRWPHEGDAAPHSILSTFKNWSFFLVCVRSSKFWKFGEILKRSKWNYQHRLSPQIFYFKRFGKYSFVDFFCAYTHTLPIPSSLVRIMVDVLFYNTLLFTCYIIIIFLSLILCICCFICYYKNPEK